MDSLMTYKNVSERLNLGPQKNSKTSRNQKILII